MDQRMLSQRESMSPVQWAAYAPDPRKVLLRAEDDMSHTQRFAKRAAIQTILIGVTSDKSHSCS